MGQFIIFFLSVSEFNALPGWDFLDILGRGPWAHPIGNFIGVRAKIGIFLHYSHNFHEVS